MGGSDTESQLASFFLYSFVIYPVTNYLLSPQRQYNNKHGRWRGILYALLFLSLIAGGQMFLENLEQGPNFYQSLRATRHSSLVELKRLYKKRVLETHPDKNKAPSAVQDFRRVTLANEVLSSPELKEIYDRLGEPGLRMFAGEQGSGSSAVRVVDPSFVLMQLLLGAGSSVLMAFVMTLAEPSGEAFAHSAFGVLALLLLELVLVVAACPLPTALLPSWTPHDVISALHRLFPAAMNASRCICSALHQDPFLYRAQVLEQLVAGGSAVTREATQTACAWQDRLTNRPCRSDAAEAVTASPLAENGAPCIVGGGLVEQALLALRRRVSSSSSSSDGAARVQSLAEQLASVVGSEKAGGSREQEQEQEQEQGVLDSLFSLPYLCAYLSLQGAYCYCYKSS